MSSRKLQNKWNERAVRGKRILSAKKKVYTIKRNTIKIVEEMIEENLSKEWFLENCVKLCQLDYDDVVKERSIGKICGYPLCDEPIIEVMKKYHISRTFNKVFDLSERKYFCRNQCYTASNYLKAQLSEVPLYMRKTGSSISIKLISELENRGCAGKEVQFHHSLSPKEIDKSIVEPTLTEHFADILQRDVKEYEEQLSRLKISENTYERPFVFNSKTASKSTKGPDEENLSDSSSMSENDTDEDLIPFPEYDNISFLCNKHMPIPDKSKKAVLISLPNNSSEIQTCSVQSSVEFIQNIFNDWFTEDTLKYLLGERKMYSMKADLLFQTILNSDAPSNSENLLSVKNEYIDLCLKIDKMQDEELNDSGEAEVQNLSRTDEVSSDAMAKADTISTSVQENRPIPKRRPKRKSKGKNKTVTFRKGVTELKNSVNVTDVSQVSERSQSTTESNFPLVDSVSQNALRRQLLTSKLKTVYFDLLPIIGLHYKDIREELKEIVKTFSLTPTNITFKPKEWKCIAFVLLRIFTKTVLKDMENAEVSKLWEASVTSPSLSIQEVENLASDLISSKQLYRVQGLYCTKN